MTRRRAASATAAHTPPGLATHAAAQRNTLCGRAKNGGPTRARTWDRPVMSRWLYQLSYRSSRVDRRVISILHGTRCQCQTPPRPRRTTPAPRRRKTDGWQRAGNLQGEEGNPFEKGFSPFPPHPPFPFPKRFSVKKTGALPVPRRKAPHPDGTAVFLRTRTAARRECRICTGRRGGFPGTAQDGSVSGRDGGRDRQSVPQGKRFRKVEGGAGGVGKPS